MSTDEGRGRSYKTGLGNFGGANLLIATQVQFSVPDIEVIVRHLGFDATVILGMQPTAAKALLADGRRRTLHGPLLCRMCALCVNWPAACSSVWFSH